MPFFLGPHDQKVRRENERRKEAAGFSVKKDQIDLLVGWGDFLAFLAHPTPPPLPPLLTLVIKRGPNNRSGGGGRVRRSEGPLKSCIA